MSASRLTPQPPPAFVHTVTIPQVNEFRSIATPDVSASSTQSMGGLFAEPLQPSPRARQEEREAHGTVLAGQTQSNRGPFDFSSFVAGGAVLSAQPSPRGGTAQASPRSSAVPSPRTTGKTLLRRTNCARCFRAIQVPVDMQPTTAVPPSQATVSIVATAVPPQKREREEEKVSTSVDALGAWGSTAASAMDLLAATPVPVPPAAPPGVSKALVRPHTAGSKRSPLPQALCDACASGTNRKLALAKLQSQAVTLSAVPTPQTHGEEHALSIVPQPHQQRFNQSLSARQARSIPAHGSHPTAHPPHNTTDSNLLIHGAQFVSDMTAIRDHRAVLLTLGRAEQESLNKGLEVELVRRELLRILVEKDKWEEEREELRKQNSELYEQLHDTQSDLKTAKQGVFDSTEAQLRLEAEHKRLHEEYAKLAHIFGELHTELLQLKEAHEENKLARANLEEQLKQENKKKDDLSSELDSIKPLYLALKPKYDSLVYDYNQQQSKLVEVQTELEALQPQLSEAIQSRKESYISAQQNANLLAIEKQLNQACKNELFSVKEEQKKLLRTQAEQSSLLQQHHERIEYFKKELTKERIIIQKEESAVTTEFLEMKTKTYKAIESAEDSKGKLEQAERTILERDQELEGLRGEFSTLRETHTSLLTEHRTLKDSHATNLTALRKSEEQLSFSSSRLNSTIAQLNALRQEHDGLLLMLDKMKLDKSTLQSKMSEQYQELQLVKKDLSVLTLSSTQTSRTLTNKQDAWKEKESRLQERLLDLKEDLSSLRIRLVEESSERRSAEQEVKSLRSRLNNNLEKFSRLQNKYDTLANLHHDCILRHKEHSLIQKRLIQMEIKFGSLHNKYDTSQSDVSKYTDEVVRIQSLYEKELLERKEAQASFASLQSQLDASEARIEKLQGKNASLIASVEQAKESAKVARIEISKLKKQLQDSHTDLERVKEQSVEREEKLSTSRVQERDLQTELYSCREEISTLKESISSLELQAKQSSKLRAEIIAWRREKQESEHADSLVVQEIKKQLEACEKKLEIVTKAKESLGSTLSAVRISLSQKEQELKDLTSELSDVRKSSRERTGQLTREIKDLQSSKDNFEEKVTTLTTALEKEQGKTQSLTALNGMLRDKHNEDTKQITKDTAILKEYESQAKETQEKVVSAIQVDHIETVSRLEAKISSQSTMLDSLTLKVRELAGQATQNRMKELSQAQADYAAYASSTGGSVGDTTTNTGSSNSGIGDFDAAPDIHFLYRSVREQCERLRQQLKDATGKHLVEIEHLEAEQRIEVAEKKQQIKVLEDRIAGNESKHAIELQKASAVYMRHLWLGSEAWNLLVSIPAQLGMTVLNSTEGLSLNSGLMVTDLSTDDAAAQAGVKKGDVIERVNGQVMVNTSSLLDALRSVHAGDVCTLSLRRVSADGSSEEHLEIDVLTTSSHYTPHQLVVIHRNARSQHYPEDEQLLSQMIAARGIKPPDARHNRRTSMQMGELALLHSNLTAASTGFSRTVSGQATPIYASRRGSVSLGSPRPSPSPRALSPAPSTNASKDETAFDGAVNATSTTDQIANTRSSLTVTPTP